MMVVAFKVSGVPTAQGRPRFIRSIGRAYPDAKTKRATRSVAQEAALTMAGRPPLDGRLHLDVTFVFLRPASMTKRDRLDPFGHYKTTKPDLSNLIKLVEDAINGIVIRDDARISKITSEKLLGDVTETRIVVRQIGGGLFEAKPETTQRVEQGALQLMEGGR